MNEQTALQLRLALVNAQVALQSKNKMEARRWALAAAQIAPDNEEPWLILAAISSPTASVAYLQRALEVNPKSERAFKGMQWALQRLSDIPSRGAMGVISVKKEETQPIKIKPVAAEVVPVLPVVEDAATESPFNQENLIDEFRSQNLSSPQPKPVNTVPPKKVKSKRSGTSWVASVLITLILLSTALVVWAAMPGWIALARSSAAPIPANVLEKPTLTPTATATATQTSTPTSTATPEPTATNTPQPTNTPLPKPTAEPQQPVVLGDFNGHWIDIDLGEQRLYAYDGSTLINSFLVSTGTYLHPTVTGQYNVYVKYRYTDMSGPGYYLPDVPFTMYFYSGYGIHGTYWHDNFGTPMSHGCVNMRTSEAEWLFNWSSVGTLVNIHY